VCGPGLKTIIDFNPLAQTRTNAHPHANTRSIYVAFENADGKSHLIFQLPQNVGLSQMEQAAAPKCLPLLHPPSVHHVSTQISQKPLKRSVSSGDVYLCGGRVGGRGIKPFLHTSPTVGSRCLTLDCDLQSLKIS
jgi:hypothetical protein